MLLSLLKDIKKHGLLFIMFSSPIFSVKYSAWREEEKVLKNFQNQTWIPNTAKTELE